LPQSALYSSALEITHSYSHS